MTEPRATLVLRDGAALLERAIGYTLGQLSNVTPGTLACRTPCPDWDLATLLLHVDDSLAALQEAMALGEVGPGVAAGSGDPATAVRDRASLLLGSLAGQHQPLVCVGGYPLPAEIVTSAGAVDIAVHGWDIARACGRPGPIPGPLAGEILEVSRLLVTEADRPGRFGSPVPLSPQASVSDRLLAYLGRNPL
jgi:uncharacterized protein (TIGR03086 family)